MTRPLALIVDDEPDIRELLDITLQRMDVDTRSVGSVAEALAALQSTDFDLCLADMRLPDGNGIDIVRQVSEHHPQTPVAMITAHGNMDSAVQALKAGAFDFVSKPVELPVLRRLVETALRLNREAESPAPPEPVGGQGLLGKSPAIERIRQMIAKVARSQAPVFITGESGTGKELAARLIHRNSARRDGPFVAVNCGAIPAELMESELFGYLKGSFTGAMQDKQGLFQAAHGGTLFLDEVADLPFSMQVKLLRAIQEKRVRPVGSASEVEVDVRLISATHKDVVEMVSEGEFRRDLFYRIHVIELTMPPLQQRREDIPVLIDHVLNRISRAGQQARPRLDRAALQALHVHPYPGNVRELENILERACALCEDGLVREGDLGLSRSRQPCAPTALQGDLESHLAGIERQLIEQALQATRWNRTAAAEQLGLTLRSLRYRMDKLGLDGDAPEAGA
jgi:two-component system response regulator PilR (NtrC family)